MGYAFHAHTWRISVTSVQHYTLPDKFCDFCTTFIPLPDSSVTSVTTWYRYPGMGYTFRTRTRGRSLTSLQSYTLLDKICDFCRGFAPVPDSSVTSVRLSYPYPTVLELLEQLRTGTRVWGMFLIPVPEGVL